MSKLFFKNPEPFGPWVTQSLQEAATHPEMEISVQGNFHSPSLLSGSGGLIIFVFAKVVLVDLFLWLIIQCQSDSYFQLLVIFAIKFLSGDKVWRKTKITRQG